MNRLDSCHLVSRTRYTKEIRRFLERCTNSSVILLEARFRKYQLPRDLKRPLPSTHLQQRILPERAKTSNALCSKQTVLQVRLLWNRRTLRPGPKVTLTKSRST